MADINLLQNQLKDTTLVADRRSMLFIWISGGIFSLVLLGGGALYFLTNSVSEKTNEVLASNNNLLSQISKTSGDLGDAKIFQAKLSNINLLLNKHTYVTPALQELEKVIYQRAQFVNTNITIDAGKMHIEGNVANYTDLGKLMLGLGTSEYFRNVKLLSVSPVTGENPGYRFSIDLITMANLYTNKDQK